MILQAARRLGAVAILATGAVHLQQYLGQDFQAIPTIGTLFLMNAIGSGIIGLGLLFPVERVVPNRLANAAIALLAAGAVAIAVGALVALFISESGGLFGFTESGYRTAVVLAIIAESATILLLAPVLASTVGRAVGRERQPSTRSEWSASNWRDRSATR